MKGPPEKERLVSAAEAALRELSRKSLAQACAALVGLTEYETLRARLLVALADMGIVLEDHRDEQSAACAKRDADRERIRQIRLDKGSSADVVAG